VGPGADYYCPRFLHYERTGRSIPGWHWPAFFLPVIWAFYRKLWLPGILFALLPLLGAANLDAIAPALGDSALAWIGITACALWIIPGIVAATLANTLYFHRIRHLVRWAEARTEKRHEVAALLAKRRAASPLGALVLGGGTLAVVVALALPDLDALHQEFQLRAGVAESLAAVKPLQREIEANWRAFGTFPSQIDYAPVRSYLGAAFLDAVYLTPVNGRLRLPARTRDERALGQGHPARADRRCRAAYPMAVHSGGRARQVPAGAMPGLVAARSGPPRGGQGPAGADRFCACQRSSFARAPLVAGSMSCAWRSVFAVNSIT